MWLEIGGGDSPSYTLLGKDTDDLSIDLNPDSESTKNVLGETNFSNNGYTPSLSNDSYIARSEDSIYKPLETIVNTLATDEDTCGGTMIVATLTDEVKNASGTTTLTGKGYKVPVQITVDTDGGSTSGYGIAFTINENGSRIQGTVSVADKVPTFTESTK